LHHTITPEDAGAELRAVAREERPAVVLKAWEQAHLMEAVNANLAKRHPDYEAINRLMKTREDLFTAGFRPRLATPMLLAILGKMKDRELNQALSKAGYRSAEIDRVEGFVEEAESAQKELVGKKLNAPIDAYKYLEQLPLDQTAYLLAESRNSAALSKIKAYLNKWRPMRIGLPTVANELAALGMERGPKFDSIVEQVFAIQLTGRGKTPEEREKILRKLSGIKEPPKKKETPKKAGKGASKAEAAEAIAGANAAKAGAAAKAAHGKDRGAAKHPPAKPAAHAKTGGKKSARK
jgi:hypothetical protein